MITSQENYIKKLGMFKGQLCDQLKSTIGADMAEIDFLNLNLIEDDTLFSPIQETENFNETIEDRDIST